MICVPNTVLGIDLLSQLLIVSCKTPGHFQASDLYHFSILHTSYNLEINETNFSCCHSDCHPDPKLLVFLLGRISGCPAALGQPLNNEKLSYQKFVVPLLRIILHPQGTAIP